MPYLEGQDCDIMWLSHTEETSRCRASKPVMVNMGRIKYMFSLSRNIHRYVFQRKKEKGHLTRKCIIEFFTRIAYLSLIFISERMHRV